MLNLPLIRLPGGSAASFLLLASGVSFGQAINLSAVPTSVTAPDGSVIPMWGYNCGIVTSTLATSL